MDDHLAIPRSRATVPIEAALAVADLYWRRSQADPRPPAEDDDLGAAIGIYALIADANEDAVPEALRPAVTEAREVLGEHGEASPGANWDLREIDAAVALLAEAEAGGDEAALAEAITRFRTLLQDVPAGTVDAGGQPVESVILSNLGIALRLHAVQTGNPGEADEAADLTRRALAVGQPEDSGALHLNLAITLGTRFAFTGSAEDLREAVAVGQRGVELTDPGDPEWPVRASNLSGLLRVRYDQTGNVDDLEQSIALSRTAAEATPDGDPGRGLRWSNLSNGLAARYELRRDPRELDAAVTAGRRAAETAPQRHPARGPIIANVANLLLTRFEQFGELADLDESIRLGNEALRSARVNGPARAALQSNLGNAYRSRYELRSDPEDLRNALAMTKASVQSTGPGDPALASRLSNRAMTLLTEYERASAATVLDEAVQAGREAVAAAGPRPERLSKLLSNLSILLARHGEASADAQRERDVAEAVTACESAVTVLHPDSPDRAIRLVNLAGTLVAQARLSAGADAAGQRLAAIDCYQQAAAVETAAVPVRVQAARSQGDLAARLGAWPAALNGYAQGVSMLSRLVPRSITRRSREQFLIRAGQLAADSAASALQAGDLNKAVELLEQGRAVLWAQALEQSPAADLAASHSAIAARLGEIAAVLS